VGKKGTKKLHETTWGGDVFSFEEMVRKEKRGRGRRGTPAKKQERGVFFLREVAHTKNSRTEKRMWRSYWTKKVRGCDRGGGARTRALEGGESLKKKKGGKRAFT